MAATPQGSKDGKKILIAYFSDSGNTRRVAQKLQALTGGDVVEIAVTKAYPAGYQDCVDQARTELRAQARPTIKAELKNLDAYQTIILAYPNWWGTYPMPVATFIEQLKLDGKTLAPLCTHEGSAMGNSVNDLKKACPKSRILPSLAIRGGRVGECDKDLQTWLPKVLP